MILRKFPIIQFSVVFFFSLSTFHSPISFHESPFFYWSIVPLLVSISYLNFLRLCIFISRYLHEIRVGLSSQQTFSLSASFRSIMGIVFFDGWKIYGRKYRFLSFLLEPSDSLFGDGGDVFIPLSIFERFLKFFSQRNVS